MRFEKCYRNFLLISVIYFTLSLIFQYRFSINNHFKTIKENKLNWDNEQLNSSESVRQITKFGNYLQALINNFQYNEDSLMFYGNQSAIHALLERIFSRKISALKMALIGGSTSVPHGIQASPSIKCQFFTSKIISIR